jgi:4-carboxymuconolactone decarboxylase
LNSIGQPTDSYEPQTADGEWPSHARIPFPTPEEMTPAQRRVHDAVISGPRGQMIGPLRAAIHSPELAERWSRLGEFLRYQTVLPARLNELAILVTSRRYASQIEWWIHAQAAAEAGLPERIIEAIHECRPPACKDPDDAAVYEFSRQLQLSGNTSLEVYRAITERWGVRGVVELAAVIGYYTMVAMTLNVHGIPLPDGLAAPFASIETGHLSDLPAATT